MCQIHRHAYSILQVVEKIIICAGTAEIKILFLHRSFLRKSLYWL